MNAQKLIQDVSAELPVSQAILLYLSVVLERDRAGELLGFLPEEAQGSMQNPLAAILSIPREDRSFPLVEEIQRLAFRNKPYRGLEEIDGSWLWHYLKSEKPSVIALILKHLPADKATQVLDRMDPEIRARLPQSDRVEEVAWEAVEVVRRRFEENLISFSAPQKPRILDLRVLRNLSGAELLTLVRDLGFEILALAFQGVQEKALIELVKNLDEEDARRLFDKFSVQRKANRGDIKSSQLEILGLSLRYDSGKDLVIEAGVQRLARSLVGMPEELVVVLQHKLPLKAGYQLRRYVDDFRRGTFSEAALEKSRNNVIQQIAELSKKGEIDRQWAGLRRRKQN